MSKHNELSTPVIHRIGIPLRSLTALGATDYDNNDYFVVTGNEQRDKTRVSVYRAQQLIDSLETQSVLETKLDGASSNMESLKEGLFCGIIQKGAHPGTKLWLNIYSVFDGEQGRSVLDSLETKSSLQLDKLEASLSYLKLVADSNTCQIATISRDKLLIAGYERNLTIKQSFLLSSQDSCYWKPCGDWQPDNSGNHLIIGRGQNVQLWDTRSQDACLDFGIFPSLGQILVVRFFPLRQHFVMGGFSSGKVAVWDTRSSLEPILSWTAHYHAVLDLKSNRSHERLIATCGTDAIVHIWDMGELLSTVSFEKEIDRQQLSCVKCVSLEYHSDTIYALDWGISNEFTIASAGYDGNLILSTIPSFVRDKVFS